MGTAIWIIFIALVVITNIAGKKRQRAAESESDNEGRSILEQIEEMIRREHETGDEAWPQIPRPQSQPMTQAQAQPTAPQREQVQPTTPLQPQPRQVSHTAPQPRTAVQPRPATTASARPHTHRQEQGRDQGLPMPDPVALHATATACGDESIGELIENFDIRRAIIYSEIMHPLYNDEEWEW